MPKLTDILASQPVLADGAMGTVLYSRGILINKCYDELNLSDPSLILAIHEEYLQAGAQILETNTFGANRLRLVRHGLGAKVGEMNAAGVRLARQAVDHLRERKGGNAWVAGSVGPLGVRLEPLGKTSLDEARAAFAEQIRALADSGVDFLSIETMPALSEAREALLAALETAPELPALVMVTVDDESNCLDGSSPEQAAALLTEWGASAVGVNCSTGPSSVLTALGSDAARDSLASGRHAERRTCHGPWRAGTFISARPSLWRALHAKRSLQERRLSAGAAVPRLITFGRWGMRCVPSIRRARNQKA